MEMNAAEYVMQEDENCDLRKKVDLLVASLAERSYDNRLAYVEAEKPLRELARANDYADAQLKLLRKVVTRKIQQQDDVNFTQSAAASAINKLSDLLIEGATLDLWLEMIVRDRYADNHFDLVSDLLRGEGLREDLASVLHEQAVHRFKFYGETLLREASKSAAQHVFSELKSAFGFFDSRKERLLPIFSRELTLSTDKYGGADYSGFLREVEEFCSYLSKDGRGRVFSTSFARRILSQFILLQVQEENRTQLGSFEIPLDSVDFEVWCAQMIKDQGWAVTTTPGSGDQGVDLLATRDGFSVAIQCKRYTSPVGNAAVQEAHTGRTVAGARAAMVLGTGGFTRAANQMAAVCKVELLDAADIFRFSEIFGFKARSYTPINSAQFRAETYGQAEVVKMIYWGIPENFSFLEAPCVQKFQDGFDGRTGMGEAPVSAVEMAQLLSAASLVLTSNLQLDDATRQKLLSQPDVNRLLVSDISIREMPVYLMYKPENLDELVQAFRAYVDQFNLHSLDLPFLREFE
jgi:hypothetical protein